MNKEFIPYEEAKVLEELGMNFADMDMPCYTFYDSNTKKLDKLGCISAPLYQQAFRFFREKYGFSFYIFKCGENDYHPVIHLKGSREPLIDTLLDEWETYEEAELDCLKTLIELTKNGKYK